MRWPPWRRRRARKPPTSARWRHRARHVGLCVQDPGQYGSNHRDRIAFVRLCSGKLSRGMKVKQVRSGKTITLNAPQFFFAQNRALAEEAYAGDVVGIPNHGTLRIGDSLTEARI